MISSEGALMDGPTMGWPALLVLRERYHKGVAAFADRFRLYWRKKTGDQNDGLFE